MTRKDYNLLAEALSYAKPSKQAKPQGYQSRLDAWRNTSLVVADALALKFQNFDKTKFMAAIGLPEQPEGY